MISSYCSNSGRNLPWLERLRTSWCRVRPHQKGCVEGDRAAAVWCKTIIFHHRHIAAVTVVASQLSRAHGGSKSLKWVAIRWVATSPTVVQQRTRHFEVVSINRKRYILVIVDDYSRYTWTLFLRSKDETPEVLKDFLMMIQTNLQALLISVRTDRGTEFLNKTLNAFFKEEGIEHQISTPRTPEQNGIVER
ncbi:putative ribonuclease H-like domain-containing protein [Tanacetum coccineum]